MFLGYFTFCIAFCSVFGIEAFQSHLVAHRGASDLNPTYLNHSFPENTLSAMYDAYEKGISFVECDVHQTLDGKLIVLHDDTLRRTAYYNSDFVTDLTSEEFQQVLDQKVSELNYHLLSQIDVGNSLYPSRIPLLEDFFQVIKGCPERKLIIDIKSKSSSIISDLSKLIYESGIDKNQLIILFGDLSLLQKSKMIIPDVKHFLMTISTLRSLYEIFSQEERIHYKKLFSYLDDFTNDDSLIQKLRRGDLTNIFEHIDDEFDQLKIAEYFNSNLLIRNKKQLCQIVDQLHTLDLDGIVLEYVSNRIDCEYIHIIKDKGLSSMVWNYPSEDNFSMVTEMLEAGVDLINTNQLEFIFSR